MKGRGDNGGARLYIAVWVVLAVVACADGRAATAQGQLLTEDGEFYVTFETRSTRLASAEAGRFDRLAAMLRGRPGNRLLMCVLSASDAATRRFAGARLAVVDHELARRGITAVRTKSSPSAAPENSVVLRVVGEPGERVPMQIAPAIVESVPNAAPQPLPGAAENAGSSPLQPPALAALVEEAPAAGDAPTAVSLPMWSVTPGTKLREQIAQWLPQANAAGCDNAAGPCYRLAEPRDEDPAEPWRIKIADSYRGDFLGALTWLRDGFWAAPRPDIEVTRNNVIILRAIGAAQ
jgi:hypothetical protein